MLFNIVRGAAMAAQAFVRYRISALGVRKFLGEAAGIYAIDEMVQLTAKHNDWVKENQNTITMGLSLSLMARNSFLSLVNRGSFGKFKVLFSRISLAHPLSATKSWLSHLSVKATNSGVSILQKGSEVLTISVSGGKFVFNHSGTPAAAALLAATFGGAIPTTREEWRITGEQLAVQYADLELTLEEAELRSRLHAFSPVTLLSSGSMLLDNFLRDHRSFPEERAVAILSEVLSSVDTVVGPFSLEGFKDVDEDNIIRLNGMFYVIKKEGDAFILSPAKVEDGPRFPLDDEHEPILYALESILSKVFKDGGVTLLRVAETDRFMSTPFTVGQLTTSLVVDIKDGMPFFAIGRNTLFDDSADNLEDTFAEGELEVVARWISSIPSFFGLETEEEKAEEEADFEKRVRAVLPAINGSYRKGFVYLSADALSESMGK